MCSHSAQKLIFVANSFEFSFVQPTQGISKSQPQKNTEDFAADLFCQDHIHITLEVDIGTNEFATKIQHSKSSFLPAL